MNLLSRYSVLGKTIMGMPGWLNGLAPAFSPGRDPGVPGSSPTSGSLKGAWSGTLIPGPWDHDLNQRQLLNHWATQVPWVISKGRIITGELLDGRFPVLTKGLVLCIFPPARVKISPWIHGAFSKITKRAMAFKWKKISQTLDLS